MGEQDRDFGIGDWVRLKRIPESNSIYSTAGPSGEAVYVQPGITRGVIVGVPGTGMVRHDRSEVWVSWETERSQSHRVKICDIERVNVLDQIAKEV